MEFPEQGEFVLVTIKKILPYGAFCSLDEYGGIEGFVHVSEVFPGWVRNIHKYIREKQKAVALVLQVDKEKNQIDLSLKRVSEVDKKRKMEAYEKEKRGEKLLEIIAKKLGKTLEQAYAEAGNKLIEDYGTIYDALEAASYEKKIKTKLSEEWIQAIQEVASKEITKKRVEIKAMLTINSFAGDGIEKIKSALTKVEKIGLKDVEVKVHYVGAPHYSITIIANDFKAAEKTISKIEEVLKKEKEIEYEISR